MHQKHLLNATTKGDIKVVLARSSFSTEETIISIHFFNGKQYFTLNNDLLNYQSTTFYIPYVSNHIKAVPISPSTVGNFDTDPKLDILADGGGEWRYDKAKPGMTFTFTLNN